MITVNFGAPYELTQKHLLTDAMEQYGLAIGVYGTPTAPKRSHWRSSKTLTQIDSYTNQFEDNCKVLPLNARWDMLISPHGAQVGSDTGLKL